MDKLGCEFSKYKIDCPNMKKIGSDTDCEYYKCEKCGQSLEAYYEEMR